MQDNFLKDLVLYWKSSYHMQIFSSKLYLYQRARTGLQRLSFSPKSQERILSCAILSLICHSKWPLLSCILVVFIQKDPISSNSKVKISARSIVSLPHPKYLCNRPPVWEILFLNILTKLIILITYLKNVGRTLFLSFSDIKYPLS